MADQATSFPKRLNGHMGSVLLIEDDPSLRDELLTQLRKTGHHILDASNGLDGLDQFHSHDPDLVLTEVSLPEKGGLEVIVEIKGDRPLTKIFAMSSPQHERGVDLLEIAMMLGAIRTFAKPVNVHLVAQAVRDELGTANY